MLRDHYTNEIEYDKLPELRWLHSLRMNGFNSAIAKDVLEAIVRGGGTQLKRLTLMNSMENYSTLPITQMPSIEYLRADYISDNVDMKCIADSCRNLIKISVFSMKITIDGIRNVLQLSTKLKKASFEILKRHKQQLDISVVTDIAKLREMRDIDLTVKINYFSLQEVGVFCGTLNISEPIITNRKRPSHYTISNPNNNDFLY